MFASDLTGVRALRQHIVVTVAGIPGVLPLIEFSLDRTHRLESALFGGALRVEMWLDFGETGFDLGARRAIAGQSFNEFGEGLLGVLQVLAEGLLAILGVFDGLLKARDFAAASVEIGLQRVELIGRDDLRVVTRDLTRL